MLPQAFDFLVDTPTVMVGGELFPTGWTDRPRAVAAAADAIDADPDTGHSEFLVAGASIAGTGDGKTALLYPALLKVAGRYVIRWQKIGDCTSMGPSCCVDHAVALQILAGEALTWTAEAATEPTYAGGRHEVGGDQLGSSDGGIGAWVAKFLLEWGAVPRAVYGDLDLTEYSGARARAWGRPGAGVPDALEPTLHLHPFKTASRIRSWEQARDAVANLYPISLCSNQGFNRVRDAQGFCRASGSWAHCMAGIGVRADRPGILIQNSWGPDGCTGPKALDQPDGSFWADAATIDRMCQSGDCWAFSGYVGFQAQPDLDQFDFLRGA